MSETDRQRSAWNEETVDTRSQAIRRTLEGMLGVPALDGNDVTVLRNGDAIFPAMLEAIDRAERSIDLLTFIYWSGDIADAFADRLAAAARRGVRVRVLLDGLGCRPMDSDLIDRMEAAGCDVRWFRPVASGEIGEVNHRTHRKILICDERVSFTGGVGIADEWNGDARDETEWRDTHFRIVGPATDGLRGAFIDNWAETQGELFDPDVDQFPPQPVSGPSTIQVVRGAAETGSSDVSTMFRVLVQLARRRLRITTAYFNPDDLLLDLLEQAADRGVEVSVLLPGPHADKRFVQLAGEAVYERLLEHGVEIWCFQPSMLHAKVLTVDGMVASIGSSNINNRSMQYDEEVNLVVFDPAVVATLDGHFDEDLARSVKLDLERWQERTVVQKAAEKVVGAVSRLI
jgi:cardiolipin synthase